MICSACREQFDAVNQHSACPKCGQAVRTATELDDDHAEHVRAFEEWADNTTEQRDEAERDRDFYNGHQWDAKDEADLQARGQAPAVNNLIFPAINGLLGIEIAKRTDPRALPATPAHDQDAEAITDALRSVCETQDFDFVASLGWENLIIEGIEGAIVEHAPGDEGETPEIVIRHVPFDRLWWDHHSRMPDFSDAIRKGLSTWFDESEAIALYKKRGDASKDFETAIHDAASSSGGDSDKHPDRPLWATGGKRKRVQIVEEYYLRDGEWWVCHFTKSGFVIDPKPVGYVDEDGVDICPLEMTSGVIDRDGSRYGLVRHMIWPQQNVNKRESKALHLMSTRQAVAEEGVVQDVNSARSQLARPDGWITVRPGALRDGSFKVESTADMAQGQFALLAEARNAIERIGPEIPQLNAMPAGTSGRAFEFRMKISGYKLARFEDNHRRWKRQIFKQIWYRVRQFWTGEMWLRVRDDAERLGFRFVGLNRPMTHAQRLGEMLDAGQPLDTAVQSALGPMGRVVLEQARRTHALAMQQRPDAQQLPESAHDQMVQQILLAHPALQEPFKLADVATIGIDIVVDESPDTAILQGEEAERLTQLAPAFLQAEQSPWAKQILELVLESSQLRNKRRLLDMLRKPPDPQAQQRQQMQQQMQVAGAKAKIDKTQAEAGLAAARARAEQVDAALAPGLAEAEQLQSQGQAMVHAANTGVKIAGGS